jgi:4-amino-4-deoxy-L-arabinose transferase-like glycosyltransferase
VVAGDRRWQSWAGLALAAAPALFWVFFVIGEFLGPAH